MNETNKQIDLKLRYGKSIKKQAGAELGQAQLKLGLDFIFC